MRKTLFVLGIITLSFVGVQAQQTQSTTVISPTGTAIRLNTFAKPINEKVITEDGIAGSKYHEEKYKMATVYLNGKVIHEYAIRYNAYHDEIEILNGEKPFALLKQDGVEVVLKNYSYVMMKNDVGIKGYFIDFNKDASTSLVLKPKKTLKKAVEPSSGLGGTMPPTFTEDYQYYIKDKSGNLKTVRLKKKDLLKVLNDKKSEIEKYASSSKLSYKKEKDVIKILDHYNTL
ncbi:hypothetical protein [Aquimarina sp. 2201CG5-10]|uniref:hypothetical protein n=1 Tax=Aquimarina callyspongiae TaxID=3098150 RepID=UPI002AB4E096|nr:hypothetical protein [Aquimarina sp. 2201CG5-10]MDY8137713.1 hypothetical protein [Aquimarina sp. 2201CG5-10]